VCGGQTEDRLAVGLQGLDHGSLSDSTE
jgi:hypothetical protein